MSITSYKAVESSLTYCDNVDFINIKTPSTIFNSTHTFSIYLIINHKGSM